MRPVSALPAFQGAHNTEHLPLASSAPSLLRDEGGGEEAAEEDDGQQGVDESLLAAKVCCHGSLAPVYSREQKPESRVKVTDMTFSRKVSNRMKSLLSLSLKVLLCFPSLYMIVPRSQEGH